MQDDVTLRTLDEFLFLRKVPAIPEGLSERIVAAALREDKRLSSLSRPKEKRGFWAGLWEEILGQVALPRPAYALALLLVVGISAGTYGDYADTLFLPGVTTQDLSGFMSIEDRFVAAEFLNGDSL